MLEQPIPEVTDEDVKRIAVRDFGEMQSSLVISLLEEFGKQSWNQHGVELPRVRLAILKLANGDLDRLLDETKTAIEDFRDVLGWAEYPRYCREISLHKVSQSVTQAVIDDDWRQYQEWLKGRPT